MELSASAYYDKAIEIYETIIHDPVSYFEEKLDACDRMAHCYHELGQKEQELQSLLKTFNYDVPRADYVCRIAYYFKNSTIMKKRFTGTNWRSSWRCRAIDYTALIKRPGHGFPICADVLLRKTRAAGAGL